MKSYPRVLANSLPKSGTHLLTQLLDVIGMKEYPFHLSGSLLRVQGSNPFRKRQIKHRHDPKGIRVDLDNNTRINRDWLESRLAAVPYGSYIQGHCPYSQELEELLRELKYKVLFIIRDPRDVVVSYFHHMIIDKEYPPHKFFTELHDNDERLKYAIIGTKNLDIPGLYCAPIDYRLEGVIGWIESRNTIEVRFESLIGNKGGGSKQKQIQTIQPIMDALEIKCDLQIEEIAEKVFSQSSPTFRKGKIGDWKNHFSEANIQLFNEIAAVYLVKLGYQL